MPKNGGGRDFKPGQSGNPKGRPPLDPEIKKARALNRAEFERIANELLYSPKSELSKRVTGEHTPSIEALVAAIVMKAVSQGDHQRLGFLLDRLIGPVKAFDPDGANEPTRQNFTAAEMIQIIHVARGEGVTNAKTELQAPDRDTNQSADSSVAQSDEDD